MENNKEFYDILEETPLPDQLPNKIQIQDTRLLNSSSVQSLIQQNQDLMARLTVAIKRNMDLEERLETQSHKNQTIQAEFDFYKDHNRFVKERVAQLEFDLNNVTQDKIQSEKDFAQVYSDLQSQKEAFQNLKKQKEIVVQALEKEIDSINETLGTQVQRKQRMRERIRKIIRPYVRRLKTELNIKKADLAAQEKKITRQNDLLKDLKEKLSEAIDHIQKQRNSFESDQAKLVEQYESKYQKICEEVGRLKNINTTSEEKINKLNHVIEELTQKVSQGEEREVDLENRIVSAHRSLKEAHNEIETIKNTTNARKLEMSTEITKLTHQISELTQELKQHKERGTKLDEECGQYSEQLTGLQLLYDSLIEKHDQLKSKMQSTERVNQELSRNLNEQRKRADAIATKYQEAQEGFNKKISALGHRFQNIQKQKEEGNKEARIDKELVPPAQKELLNRIQVLLSEIQSGHSNLEG